MIPLLLNTCRGTPPPHPPPHKKTPPILLLNQAFSVSQQHLWLCVRVCSTCARAMLLCVCVCVRVHVGFQKYTLNEESRTLPNTLLTNEFLFLSFFKLHRPLKSRENITFVHLRMYHWRSLCTCIYSHTRCVTIGNSGLCCCDHVMSLLSAN